MQHFSIRGSGASTFLFKKMFPNCEEALKMQLGKTKVSYFIVHGIAPYYQIQLKKMCFNCSQYVVGFDESFNKIAQRGQMDISIRFWDSDSGEAVTRYYTSAFLGHATAEVLLETFLKALDDLDLQKLLQVSMDGPNVNKKFLRLLNEFLTNDSGNSKLLDLGSCGLHALNNAFKNVIKSVQWDVTKFLSAIHYLFHNIPSRRADFMHYTKTEIFPFKFCAVRWLENSSCAERAMNVLPSIIKYIETCKKVKKEPKCDSYETIC